MTARYGRALLGTALLAVLLELVTRTTMDRSILAEVISGLPNYVVSDAYLTSVVASTRRALTGFAVASAIAIPVGLTAGTVRQFEWTIDGIVSVFRPISPLAWIPLAIIWLGFTEEAAIFIVAYTCFFPIALGAMSAIRDVASGYVETARVLGARRIHIIRRIFLPAALPGILTGMRIGFTVAWSVLVAAELIVGVTMQSGLGYLLFRSSLFVFSLPNIVTIMLTLALIGIVANETFLLMQRTMTPWYGATRGSV